jgi:uncharacterized membrane protein YeiH
VIPLDTLLGWLDLAGVAVFAASGALVAARKRMDVIGFVFIGAVTGFGGGTLRDLLLGRTPVFWLRDPAMLAAASAMAVLIFFAGHRLRRGQAALLSALLWADAVGLSLFAVLGAEIALISGMAPWAAVLLGMITASFGGVLRDVLCNEVPLLLRKEIYALAALAGAAAFILLRLNGVWRDPALLAGMATCFAIRAAAIARGWSLPAYHGR